ncbi:MAG: hypothetical protein HY360_17565 [Verrucomicrobia bacterium]|nr:hypothetical protein [Verrucomicrobiota bacterium]
MKKTYREIYEELGAVPVIDIHTHLIGGKLAARGLHDVMLYHMSVSDLYAAGCPSGGRLTEYPKWPTEEEAHHRIREAIPYLRFVKNTHIAWGMRIILNDLYGWREPITENNWRKLDAMIRERADDRAWRRQVLAKVNIKRSCTEFARRGKGEDDDLLQYSLEWAMFARCQWGEFDTAVYELERCWGRRPESPSPIGKGQRPPPERTIQTLDDVRAAMNHYIASIPCRQLVSTAATLSTEINYRLVTDKEMAEALLRRDRAGERERDIYASYIQEAFLSGLEPHGEEIVYQFALGAEPLPFETGSRLPQRTLSQLAEMLARHPKLRFQCFLASRHGNQSLCTMARELPNLSLAGYWWHNFYPDVIRQVMAERLDMLPVNKQMGFFSDAYCIEWAYAKAILIRKQMAAVLTTKVEQGQHSIRDAIEIARMTLFDAPQRLLNIKPVKEQ